MRWLFLFGISLWVASCGDADTPVDETPAGNGGKGDIIGDDDRRDEFSEDVSDALKKLGASTAMVIENAVLGEALDGAFTPARQLLGESYYMCPDETNWTQPVTGMCSAWLVAPDIIVTNGHCVTSQPDCDNKSFVFDYAKKSPDDTLSTIPQENVFACDQVLAWDYTSDCDIDFAVIKLDRPVEGREPLKVRPAGAELKGDSLVVIGHPFGIPRKYALKGEVLLEGANAFTTTHDIIGGNSGSAIFDAETGEVQGLVTCGGSNFEWEYYNEGWELETKTGKPCDSTCDDAGEYFDGTWEGQCFEGRRRACACDEGQLVWQTRPCLSFENDTEGQCTREYRTTEDACRTAPWLCAPALAQHTHHFSGYIGEWDVYTQADLTQLEAGAEQDLKITIPEGHAQALSVAIEIAEQDYVIDGANIIWDLEATLVHPNGTEFPLSGQGLYYGGHTYEFSNVPTLKTQPFEVPFLISGAYGLEAGGEWTLKLRNVGSFYIPLKSWSVQILARPESEITVPQIACVGDCQSPYLGWPDPIIDTFEGEAVQSDVEGIEGELAPGWRAEVMDPEGLDYEVFKSRKSQTMAMTKGEFAIIKDFGSDLGDRTLTVDYRYDGIGWFQIWAGDHILFTKNDFSQETTTLTLPAGASNIRFVLGATNQSQDHELTLFSLSISPPAQE